MMQSSMERTQFLSLPVVGTDEHVNSSMVFSSNNLRVCKSVDQLGNHASLRGTDHEEEESVSDSESEIRGSSNQKSQISSNDLAKVGEEDSMHQNIKYRLLSGLGSLGEQEVKIDAICKVVYSGLTQQARLRSFGIFCQAVEKKCGGNPNVKYAWYSASKDEIVKIIRYGFGYCGKPENNGVHGWGIRLSPGYYPVESVKSSTADEDGLRHLLLCRVILGRMEVVHPGSGQYHPSSGEFDSGVDDLESTREYFIWSTHINSHVLPEYVVSFRYLNGCLNVLVPLNKQTSPWMPFPTLISALSEFLPSHTIKLMKQHHADYIGRRISKGKLIKLIRQLTGDKLLTTVIKSFRDKLPKGKLEKQADEERTIRCYPSNS